MSHGRMLLAACITTLLAACANAPPPPEPRARDIPGMVTISELAGGARAADGETCGTDEECALERLRSGYACLEDALSLEGSRPERRSCAARDLRSGTELAEASGWPASLLGRESDVARNLGVALELLEWSGEVDPGGYAFVAARVKAPYSSYYEARSRAASALEGNDARRTGEQCRELRRVAATLRELEDSELDPDSQLRLVLLRARIIEGIVGCTERLRREVEGRSWSADSEIQVLWRSAVAVLPSQGKECGGVLIEPLRVVTSAECVPPGRNGMKVRSQGGLERDVCRVRRDPSGRSAVLDLTAPIPFSDGVGLERRRPAVGDTVFAPLEDGKPGRGCRLSWVDGDSFRAACVPALVGSPLVSLESTRLVGVSAGSRQGELPEAVMTESLKELDRGGCEEPRSALR